MIDIPRKSEAQVKDELGTWLEGKGCLIFDERPNKRHPNWGTFRVANIHRGKKPDLLILTSYQGGQKVRERQYVAIEVKPCFKHIDLLNGFDAVLDYFSDCCWGARYFVGQERVSIAAFVLATNFSREGYLFKEEKKFHYRVVERGGWPAFPMTFTVSRLLWRQRDNIRKRILQAIEAPRTLRRVTQPEVPLEIPEVGVLVRHPDDQRADDVLLMLSENPYHWLLLGV